MSEGWEIKMIYDGACPLCKREIAWLMKRNSRGAVAFEDLSIPDFDPSRYGVTQADCEASIHGVLPDGRVVRGMEVFRRTYRALGMGWVMAPTGWPVLRPMFDLLYRGFAFVRLRLPGRDCTAGACRTRG